MTMSVFAARLRRCVPLWLCGLAAWLLLAPSAGAVTITNWTDGAAGDWGTAANWDNGVPNGDYHAILDNANVLVNGMYGVTELDIGTNGLVRVANNIGTNRYLDLSTTMDNDGEFRLQDDGSSGYAALRLTGDATLSGVGKLLFDSDYDNRISTSNLAYVLTIAAGQTIATNGAGTRGSIQARITNNAVIDADGGVLTLDTYDKTNNNIMRATNGGTLAINGINVDNAGGTITAGSGSTLSLWNGRITGGLVTGPGQVRVFNNTSRLVDTTLDTNTDMVVGTDIATHSYLEMTGTITNNGTISLMDSGIGGSTSRLWAQSDFGLDGTGTVLFGTANSNYIGTANAAYVLTVGAGQTIATDGAGTAGQIQVNTVNNGLIDADGGSLTLTSYDKTNNHILRATNGGTLRIDANVTNTTGTITAGAGSTVNLTGSHTITGGDLTGPGDFTVRNSETFHFQDLTLSSDANVIVGNNPDMVPYLKLLGTITNNGTIRIADDAGSGEAYLRVQTNPVTLNGTGKILFDSAHQNILDSATNTHLLSVGAGQTIATNGAGTNGYVRTLLTNDGVIDADGGTLSLTHYDKTNNGILRATNGGTLAIAANVANTTGTITAGAGSTVTLSGSHTITGGDLTGPGDFTVSNSETFYFQDLTLSGGANVIVGNNPNHSPYLRLQGTITNNGTIRIADDVQSGVASLYVQSNPVTLNGTGKILFDSAHGNYLVNSVSSYLLTVGADQTIATNGAGTAGSVKTLLTNNGTIDADGGTLTLTDNSKTNNAVFQATHGGTLRIDGQIITNTTGQIIADGATSTVSVVNSTINGGTLSGTGTFEVHGNNATYLDGVTLAAGGTVHVQADEGTNARLRLKGTITNHGVIVVNDDPGSGDTHVTINSPTVNLDGTGTLLFTATGTTSNFLDWQSSANELVVGADQTVATDGPLTYGNTTCHVANFGTFDADGGTLWLSNQTKVNAGLMQATNGGLLGINSDIQNFDNGTDGTIRAGAGSEVRIVNADITGGLLEGAGTFTVPDQNTSAFDDVTIAPGATVHVRAGAGTNTMLQLYDTITNDGVIRVDDDPGSGSTQLRIYSPTVNLDGAGSILFTATGTVENTIERQSGAYNLVVGANQTIATDGAATYGQVKCRVTNSGTFHANDGSLWLTTDPKINAGLMHATNGGTLGINCNIQNFDNGTDGTIRAGAGSQVRVSASTITGGILDGPGTTWFYDSTISTLDGVTLTPSAVVEVGDNATYNTTLALKNTIVNDGIIRINDLADSGYARLYVNSPVTTINGSGVTVFDSPHENSIEYASSSYDLVIGPDQTLRSQNGSGGRIEPDMHVLGTCEALDNSAIYYHTTVGAINNDAGELKLGTWRAISTGNGATITIRGNAIHTIGENTEVVLSGAGSVFQVVSTPIESTLTTNKGTLRILDSRDYANANDFTNNATGVVELGGGTFTANTSVLNNAGEIFGFGSITPRPTNTGTIRAAGGTLTMAEGIQGGSGTVQIDPGATLDLSDGSSDSDADTLIHNGAGLNLGSNNFHVHVDYTNANWGTGNSFDHRTNVTGTGQILADANTVQSLAGDVADGATATAEMDFESVHVGDVVTKHYAVRHNGTSTTNLRGAIQTAANGGNIDDPRLSGSGVTADNFGPVAAGTQTADLAVTFTASDAGELTGQQVHVANNFDNVATQMLQFAGAAYRYANPSAHTPEPVDLGNCHVGDTPPTQALSITNDVPDDGFSENLDAEFSGTTGGVTATGWFDDLEPGQTNNSSLVVGIQTGSAGDKAGTATVNLISIGEGTSGLPDTTLASQTVNVSGAVYRYAAPSAHTPEPVTLGNVHVGDTAQQALTLANTAVADGYSENLDASFSGTTGDATATGSFDNLAPGGSNNVSLVVGIDTSTAGAKSGTATVALTSDGAPYGLGTTALTAQTVNVSGNVYRYAAPSAHTPEPIVLGNIHVGDTAQQALTLANTAAADGYSENLDASFSGTTGDATATGSIDNLGPGGSNNVSLVVGINTSTAGAKSGTATLALTSDGAPYGLGTTTLTPQTVNISGGVYRLASASSHQPEPVVLGNVHVGDTAQQALSITNTAAADSYSEALNASIGSAIGHATAAGSFGLLAPGATDSTSLVVGIDTSTAGAKSGAATITLTSDGTGSSNLGTTALTSQSVLVSGGVYRLAAASAHTPEPVDFGTVHVGDAPQQALSITNTAASGGYSEALNGSIGAGTGDATTNAGSFTLLAPGATNTTSLVVGIDTSTAGAKSGTAPIAFVSDGTGSSALGQTGLGSQTVNVQAQVNNYADPDYQNHAGHGTWTKLSDTAYTLDFGTINLGSGDLAATFDLFNNAAAPADWLAGTWGFDAGASDFSLTNFNAFDNMQAGTGLSGGLGVGLSSATVGSFSSVVTLQPRSKNSGGYDGSLDDILLTLSGVVQDTGSKLAIPDISPNPMGLGNFHEGDTAQGTLTVKNVAPAGNEDLNASFGPITGDVGNATGSVTGLAPGGTDNTSMTISVNTATAGAKIGTAQVNLESAGPPPTTLSPETIDVAAAVYRYAQANTLGAVAFGSVHIGDTAQQALSLTNQAAADGYSESLNAAFSGTTGDATATGSVSLLAPGATDNTSLVVGIDTSTAGAASGTATVALVSDGAGTSGLGQTTLTPQTINVTAAVYRYAQANTLGAVAFGSVHVGDTAQQALSLSNQAAADGYSESLNAAFSATTGDATGTGSVNLLAPGATNNSSLVVGIDTSTAGAASGTATVALVSDGAGTSGLGQTTLSPQTVNVSATAYRYADPAVNSAPLDLGDYHVGDTARGAITVQNQAPADAYSEKLNATFAGSSPDVNYTSGSISLLNPGATDNTSMVVGIDTATAGAKSGTASVALVSDGNGTSGLGQTTLTPQTVIVAADVYNLAQAGIGSGPQDLGNFHVGDTDRRPITIANIAPTDGWSENLNASFTGVLGGDATSIQGAITGLAAGSSDSTSMQVGVNTTTTGAKSGWARVSFESDGSGINSLGQTSLGTQDVPVAAAVYRLADPSAAAPNPIDFGIVHVSDGASQALTLSNNAAADSYSESLKATFTGTTGDATAAGSIGLLGPGATDSSSLAVGIDTSTAGAKSGTATLDLASDGAGSSDLGITGLPSQTVSVSGTVNNYSNLVPLKITGDGTWSGGGTSFLLDLGSAVQGAADLAAQLGVRNDVAAPADAADGNWTFALPDFTLAGFSDFVGLEAGDEILGMLVSLDTAAVGDFIGHIYLQPAEHNDSGYYQSLDLIDITVRGKITTDEDIIPEPTTMALLGLGLVALARRRRRRR